MEPSPKNITDVAGYPNWRLNGGFYHVDYVRMSFVMLQKDLIMLMWSLLLNHSVEPIHLLNEEICIDRLVHKMFIRNLILPMMKFLFYSQWILFIANESFFLMHLVDVNNFISLVFASNEKIKKSLLVVMGLLAAIVHVEVCYFRPKRVKMICEFFFTF